MSPPGKITFDMVGLSLDPSERETRSEKEEKREFKAQLATQRSESKFSVEQLLASPGSLRPGLSNEQRERVLRGLAPTPTYEVLSKVPKQLLNKKSKEVQLLRRKLARGATIVMFTAGMPCKRFIFERICAMGIKAVIIDHPDSWSKQLVDEGVVAKFMPVDMSQNSDAILEQSLNLIRNLGADGDTGEADGIATFVELSVPMVSRLAEELGLPGQSPAAVDKARDKHQTRAVMKAAGLPTPANCLIHSEAELTKASQQVGFPAVIKPLSGAASLGVKKVENAADLRAAYKEVTEELNSLIVSSGALVKNDGSGVGVAFVAPTILMEQYLDGPEVDVDVIISEGEWRYAAVADNGPCLEPYFNETWGLCPSMLPKDQQASLKKLAVDTCIALGFKQGVFHVELRYTSSGPQIIEVNARMGGGQIHETNLLVWGVDLVEENIFLSLGIPCRPDVPEQPTKCVAYEDVNSVKSGTMGEITNLPELRIRPNVVYVEPNVSVGEKVVGPEDGLPTSLFDVMVTAQTPLKALDYLNQIKSEMGYKVL
jgi:carnosine synthase